MASEQTSPKEPENWQQILSEGDETSFRELVEPYIPALTRAARHYLNYYVAQDHIMREDFTAEEVVGETLVRAWEHRQRRPPNMTLRAWLYSVLYRVTRGMVEQEKQYRFDKAISLDEPLPLNTDSEMVQEWFWQWQEWDAALNWEDVIPSTEPVDFEVPLYDARETIQLNPDTYHVLMMHDEFEMSLSDVAFAMNRAVNETAEVLTQARADLRQRMDTRSEGSKIDNPPAPEEPE